MQPEMMVKKRQTTFTQYWKARRVEGKRTLLKKVSTFSENGTCWQEVRGEKSIKDTNLGAAG